jgi:hypothetical protein
MGEPRRLPAGRWLVDETDDYLLIRTPFGYATENFISPNGGYVVDDFGNLIRRRRFDFHIDDRGGVGHG